MTAQYGDLDRHQRLFTKLAPLALLGLSVVLGYATAGLIMPEPWKQTTATVLVAGALLLQLSWLWIGPRHPKPNNLTLAYFVLRWAFAATLALLNGFFAFYVAAGYFDTDGMIRSRTGQRLGLFICSVPISFAQVGGIPTDGPIGWVVFGCLLIANNALLGFVRHLGEQSEERSTARAAAIAQLEQAQAENATLQAQLLVQAREAGVADERRRLAAEIHDTLAQGLTGIIAQLQAVESTSDPAVAKDHIARATDLARDSLGEARRSVQNLAPEGLSSDALPEVLRKTVAQWAERTGVRTECTVTGTTHRLHGELSATLLRITQEALANVAKHASASRVGVTLSFMDTEVTLDVRDDGVGFDPLALPVRSDSGGFGLDGMRARAERLAGSLTVEAEPGGGTAVSARVPLVVDER
ncbi:histidine kinase [Kribbella sandramycini]|uniref:Signal transduction histidine kinase n=2 Tax=Kribbella sandramycini TaxID=60450 RepID=A0A841SGJ0_9ACTN|nr:signal transduction histidine kinase [Kribbella sandramycini]